MGEKESFGKVSRMPGGRTGRTFIFGNGSARTVAGREGDLGWNPRVMYNKFDLPLTISCEAATVKALILVADEFEDLTLFLPWYRMREEGVDVRLASPYLHALTGTHGYRVEPDARIDDVNPAEIDVLVIPDGKAAERIRVQESAVGLARTFLEEGGRVAAIGHGLQVLISAGGLDGRTVTCSPGIRDDVRAAGANYRDEAVIRDGDLLTGRGVDDLPEFCRSLVRFLPALSRT